MQADGPTSAYNLSGLHFPCAWPLHLILKWVFRSLCFSFSNTNKILPLGWNLRWVHSHLNMAPNPETDTLPISLLASPGCAELNFKSTFLLLQSLQINTLLLLMTKVCYSFSTKHRRAADVTPPSSFCEYLCIKWGASAKVAKQEGFQALLTEKKNLAVVVWSTALDYAQPSSSRWGSWESPFTAELNCFPFMKCHHKLNWWLSRYGVQNIKLEQNMNRQKT